MAFPSACDAARAALELRAAIQKTNATLEVPLGGSFPEMAGFPRKRGAFPLKLAGFP